MAICHSSTFFNVRLLKYRISVPGQQVYNRHFLSGQFRHSILSKFEWRYFQTTYIIDSRGSLISTLVPDQDRTSGLVVDFVVDIIITETFKYCSTYGFFRGSLASPVVGYFVGPINSKSFAGDLTSP